MTVSYTEVIEKVRQARERIWLNPPEELPAVATRQGPRGQKVSIWLYAESDTRVFAELMYLLRATAADESADFGTVKKCIGRFLEFMASTFERYYYQSEGVELTKETVEALAGTEDRKAYLALLEEYMLWFGKMNYWIDLQIPWGKLTAATEKLF